MFCASEMFWSWIARLAFWLSILCWFKSFKVLKTKGRKGGELREHNFQF